jgi:hypothetical protein
MRDHFRLVYQRRKRRDLRSSIPPRLRARTHKSSLIGAAYSMSAMPQLRPFFQCSQMCATFYLVGQNVVLDFAGQRVNLIDYLLWPPIWLAKKSR